MVRATFDKLIREYLSKNLPFRKRVKQITREKRASAQDRSSNDMCVFWNLQVGQCDWITRRYAIGVLRLYTKSTKHFTLT